MWVIPTVLQEKEKNIKKPSDMATWAFRGGEAEGVLGSAGARTSVGWRGSVGLEEPRASGLAEHHCISQSSAGSTERRWMCVSLYKQAKKLVSWASQEAVVVKNSLANIGDARATGSIPGLGRLPGERNGNPLQYSCLKNSMDRGAWRAAVHEAAKSQTRLNLHTYI